MTLELPTIENYKDSDYDVAQRMVESLWRRFANNAGATSLPYWLDQFSSQNEGNRMVLRLAKDGWITTTVRYNYASIELNKAKLLAEYTQEDLDAIIVDTKMDTYSPITKLPSSIIAGATDVKLPSGVKKTGIIRTGFAKAGTHRFKYDTTMIRKYRKQIMDFSAKAMLKMEEQLGYSLRIDGAYDYESIIRHVIVDIAQNSDREYVLGKLTNDSRGRAIYQALRTIFNPISNKMARALVVAPGVSVSSEAELDDTYLFIAELVHGFDGDISRKLAKGKQAYTDRTMANDGSHFDELFENIWLERIYADLDSWYADNSHQFTTPIEVDFSSSNMVMIGLLLGHADYVDHTNYMWEVNGLSKLQIKKAQTPYVFGSSAPITKLWKKAKLDYSVEQVKLMKYQQAHGKFAIANELKDIIINHCTPSERMHLHVMDEHFTVECNRYKNVGDTTKQYIVLDSLTNKLNIIRHTTTHKVADLSQFKRYFVTGLIHNLDSQLMDRICKPMDWILPIHDAGIVTVTGARKMKELAVELMQEVYDNRRDIMLNYLKSIGLTDEGFTRYIRLLGRVEELNKDKTMNITPWLLK